MSRDFVLPERADGTIPGDLVTEAQYVRIVGHRGNRREQARTNIIAHDDFMKQAYEAARDQIAVKLSPVIVVQFNESGGIWTLIHNDKRETVELRPPYYEEVKSICHSPLAIFSVLGPYVQAPETAGWRPEIEKYRELVHKVLGTYKDAGIPEEAAGNIAAICNEATQFVDQILADGTFSLDGFRAFTERALPFIVKLMVLAGKAQAKGAFDLLDRWKGQLGDEWAELTGIVMAPYTLSVDNAAAECLQAKMDPRFVEDRLVVLQGDFGNEVDPALQVVGHLYFDRLVSRLVFGQDTKEHREMTRALSSEKDLVGDVAADAVEALKDEA